MTRRSVIATRAILTCVVAVAASAVATTRAPVAFAQTSAPVRGYEVIHAYPHDAQAFTQGLIYRDGFLYESTGLNGRSSVRQVRLETGEVVKKREVPKEYFAEGLTDWQNRLIQLTWTTERGFVYDIRSFEPQKTFTYRGEGWGLTHDDRRVILSDGTSALRFLDPESLQEIGRVSVTDGGRPVNSLNELEFIDGRVYANVWLTDRIAVIDPESGRVESWIDLTGLLGPDVGKGNDVLNGIAYDHQARRLFVTGKLWPRLFEIRLRAPQEGR